MGKTAIKWGILGLVLVTIATLGLRSCNLYTKNGILAGKYEAYRQIAKADHDILMNEIIKQNQVIADKTKEIEKILAEASKPSAAEIAKDKVIAAQHKKLVDLEAQGDLAGALSAAKAEIRAWSEKFQLAEERHGAELFDLNEAWQAKFNAEVSIAEGWEKDWYSEHNLRLLGEKRIKGLESSLSSAQFWKAITVPIAVVCGAKVGYELIGGSKMNPTQPIDKWTPFIEQIERAETFPEKFNLLATMVRMLATNEISCMESRIDELSRKFDAYMKKIYAIGILITVLLFTGINVQTIMNLVLKIVR